MTRQERAMSRSYMEQGSSNLDHKPSIKLIVEPLVSIIRELFYGPERTLAGSGSTASIDYATPPDVDVTWLSRGKKPFKFDLHQILAPSKEIYALVSGGLEPIG
ncbi:5131_t:CDS:2 [Acaulospora colombiana]|uniref:5131_t:CDS:1 n=1 Tax=Acaulospora colombiana TaxID=27376 RepID=A0ACA9NQX0_9GLOM|nr:5131_t:CDS:2 [Acaulospora colombiana]